MDRYFIDFETKSTLDITKVGAMKYLHTPDSDIICMSWVCNPPPYGSGKMQLWIPGTDVPFRLNMDTRVYAYNALFEYRVWNILGQKYRFDDLPLSIMVDVQALCNRYTFPQSLDKASALLCTDYQKDPRGKRLMNKITQPPFKYSNEELRNFFAYCIRDTEAMVEIVNNLPADELSESEQQVWEETMRINLRGVPIDLPLVKRVWAVVEYYRNKKVKEIPKMTEGKVRNVTQVKAVRDYCLEFGVDLPNLQVDTVEDYLSRVLPPPVRDILKLRQLLAKSSVAKYEKLLQQVYKDRIYDNLNYHRATTGRWGGQGFQAHNLPRASVDDIEKTIAAFYDTSILSEDVMYAASALIRSCISVDSVAVLAVADYKSIENICIAWVAGEDRIVSLFRKGLDEYKDFATDLFSVKYDEVTKEQRQISKTVILGAGYGLGAKGFIEYAEGYGLSVTHEQSVEAINKYRATHRKIKNMWYSLKDGAVMAILNPGELQVFPEYKGVSFLCSKDRVDREWLMMNLPSGRTLFYPEPEVREDTWGPLPTHMGLNSKNHKWMRQKLIPGRITENMIQALARDLLAYAKINLAESGFDVILSVHDEIVCEIPDYADQLDNMIKIMCICPPWCDDLPLSAEGVTTRRYYKI